MKKLTIFGTILILLAFLVVPAMAKSPSNGNSDKTTTGNGNSSVVVRGNQNQGNENQQNQGQHGNNGDRGNGNNDETGNGNQQQTRMRTPFYLQGVIKSIDPAAKTVVITLTHGNAQVKQYIGGDLTVKFTDTTQIFKITQGDGNESEMGEATTPSESSSTTADNDQDGSNRVAIPFDQLAVGDIVAVHGNLANEVFTATMVTVYVRTPTG